MTVELSRRNSDGYPPSQWLKPPRLEEFRPEEILGLCRGFSKDYDRLFSIMFYNRYGHRRLGCRSPERFKRWVADVFNTHWATYKRLYESVDTVKDPFLNVIMNTRGDNRELSRNKLFGSYDSRSDGNSIGAATDTTAGENETKGAQGSVAVGRTKDIGHSSQSTAEGGQKYDTTDTVNLYTETPQTPTLGGAIGGVDDTGKSPTGAVPWNNGYLTTGSDERHTAYGKDNRYTGTDNSNESDHQNESVAGSENASYGRDYRQSTNQNKQTNQAQSRTNTQQNSGTVKKNSERAERKGLEGLSVSYILKEWRETFISVDDMFLNEFSDLFYGEFSDEF